jgi:mannose-1-phosphate guanylyltransferase
MSETRVVSPIAPSSVTDDSAVMAGTLEEVELEAMLGTGTAMWAVIFAGGIGTRFWPLSTPRRPKQVLALVNERPLIADTVARLSPLVPSERVLVVTSADIAEALHEAIPEVPRANLLIEPRPLGTAAALAWGAQEVSRRAGPDTVFVALHADLAVGYPDVLRDALRRAAAIASAEPVLVTLGAHPSRAETGFGYLQPGMPIDPLRSRAEGGACRVEHFVEKPGAALADVLIERGALWNTGIFVWRARVVLDELEKHTAELQHGLPKLAAGEMEQFAELVSSVSIDRGLLERSPNIVVLPAEMEWDDVGTWASLRRVRELDDTGNGVMGQVHCVDCSGNVIHADGCCVVAYGISGMIVVSIDGLTFVTTQDRATELGPLLNSLPGSLRFNPGRH